MGKKRGLRRKKGSIQLFWITLAIATTVLITWKSFDSRAADPRIESLKRRADRIFMYEQSGGKVSFNQIAALSIALEFKDYQGASILIERLENQIK